MKGIEHPGLNVREIREKFSIEEIQQKITDLNSRLAFAYGRNQSLAFQVEMVLEVYNRAYQEQLEEQFGGKNVDDEGSIDIS